MTRTEARQTLLDAFPGSSFKIGIDCWHHSHANPPCDDVEYCVTMFAPGVTDKCDQFQAKTLEGAVAMAIAQKPVPIPDAVLDEQFAEKEPSMYELNMRELGQRYADLSTDCRKETP